MDQEIVIRRTYDLELILKTVLELPQVFEDGTAQGYLPDVVKDVWLAVYDEGEYCGVYQFNSISSVCLEAHIRLRPDKRKKATEYGKAIIQHLLDNYKFEKLIGRVPECYPHIVKHIKQFGFKKQGFNSNAWLKDGKLYGIHELGATREELIKCQ